MDSKQSMVKEAANREYRAILPRVGDACHEVLALLDSAQQDQHVQMLVLDAEDAFWNIPLRHEERRF